MQIPGFPLRLRSGFILGYFRVVPTGLVSWVIGLDPTLKRGANIRCAYGARSVRYAASLAARARDQFGARRKDKRMSCSTTEVAEKLVELGEVRENISGVKTPIVIMGLIGTSKLVP